MIINHQFGGFFSDPQHIDMPQVVFLTARNYAGVASSYTKHKATLSELWLLLRSVTPNITSGQERKGCGRCRAIKTFHIGQNAAQRVTPLGFNGRNNFSWGGNNLFEWHLLAIIFKTKKYLIHVKLSLNYTGGCLFCVCGKNMFIERCGCSKPIVKLLIDTFIW